MINNNGDNKEGPPIPKIVAKDYKHSESREIIQILERAVKSGRLREREHHFIAGTVLRKCLLDYQIKDLSPKRCAWALDIARKMRWIR